MPCIADPGEEIVAAAHRNKIKVVPVVACRPYLVLWRGLKRRSICLSLPFALDSSKRKQALLEISTDIERHRVLIFLSKLHIATTK